MASDEELKAELERLRAESDVLRKPAVAAIDSPLQLRASIKTIQLGYFLSLLLGIGIAGYLLTVQDRDERMWFLLAIPAIFAFFVAIRHIRRRLITLTILSDRLRYESGLFSKTTRTLELAKVQDVRVDQTFGQRIMNIGDLSLETAGGTSRIVMPAIDRPQDAADQILEQSRTFQAGGRTQ